MKGYCDRVTKATKIEMMKQAKMLHMQSQNTSEDVLADKSLEG